MALTMYSSDASPKQMIQELKNASHCPPANRFIKGILLGMGAFGEVYRAIDTQENQDVAVKVIPMPYKMPYIKVLRNEIYHFAWCKGHRHIVEFYGHHYDRHSMWIAMEYVHGFDAGTLQEKVGLTSAHIAYITKSVLDALDFIHNELGVIHCDIKPANIMIDQSGVAKLADFGVSMLESDRNKPLFGSRLFMAPEMHAGCNYTFSVDIWALGITIFRLSEGKNPYHQFAGHDLSYILENSTRVTYTPKLSARRSHSMRAFVESCLTEQHTRPAARDLLKYQWLLSASYEFEMASLVADALKPPVCENHDQEYIDFYAGITLPK